MSHDFAIKVEALSKQYRIGMKDKTHENLCGALADLIITPFANFRKLRKLTRFQPGSEDAADVIWALKEVSFEVGNGEVVGIIGANGAGKSTLLKIISRIVQPTGGKVLLRGRTSSLLEVGTGFHPELTGRENVYLNASILGMRKKEIDDKFDEIVSFAEIDKFIDTPIKRYSSGMKVRLAFAVAAHLNPEILIVDEVLAVGDAAFQKKCIGKMGDVARQGRTILFVSHNMRAVSDLCSRCILLKKGTIEHDGDVLSAITTYLMSDKPELMDGRISDEMHINATGELYFRKVQVLDGDLKPCRDLFFGDRLHFDLELEVFQTLESIRLMIAVEKMDGTMVCVFHSSDDPEHRPLDLKQGTCRARVSADLHLMPGVYTIHLAAKPEPGYWGRGKSYDWVKNCLDFHVEEFSKAGLAALPSSGLVCPPAKWELESLDRI